MSEEKKNATAEEVKEEARELTGEELEKVNGGADVYFKAEATIGGDVEDLY